MLLQLWSKEASYIAWRATLPNLKPEALEKQLLERDDGNEVELFASLLGSAKRPPARKMADWCQELSETRIFLNLWGSDPDKGHLETISEEALCRVVQLHNRHREMARLLSRHPKPSWTELCQMAHVADKEHRVETRHYGERRSRTNSSPSNTDAGLDKVNQIDSDVSDDYEDQAEDAATEYAEMWCRHMGEDIEHVAYLKSCMVTAEPKERPFDDMTDKRMVFCREHLKTVSESYPLCCPWHSNRAGGCNPRGGRTCIMAAFHQPRSSTYCISERGKTCPYGAKCKFRHEGDVYPLYVVRKKVDILMVVLIELKDFRSTWSTHYRAPKKTGSTGGRTKKKG